MGVGEIQNKTFMQGGGRKKNRAKKKRKKFLQRELHRWAYKLYPPEGHFGRHFIPQFSWTWFNPQ